MLIKEADSRQSDLDELNALLALPHVNADTKQQIRQEIRNIQSGIKGETDAAFQINFHYENSHKWAVIHDLRLEFEGHAAQIDHLLINRFLEKKVPSYTAVPFLVTAPIINPIVLFATYSAFGNSLQFAFLRALGAIMIALVLGIFLGFFWKEPIQKENPIACHEHDFSDLRPARKVFQIFIQAIDEFFDMGCYLVFGCLFAAIVQVYVPTRILTSISASPILAILLLMLLAFLLSLCSEADAFIGASLLSSFGLAPVLAFLVIGPMLDIKNLLMMKHYLKANFIWQFMGIVTVFVLLYSYMIGVML